MKKLLKFITCGSVDDGKSTLIGHILYDAKLLYADQEKALQLDSKVGSRGGNIDYSLRLDGLTEEREQGITIDVAYRYFTTSERSFIVADTPGHEQYTRNMAVGASFANLAVQRVCRPNHSFRGFQGEVETGSIHVGEEVRILPEDEKAKIQEIYRMDEKKDSAVAGDPVTVTLDREIDVSRGSVLTKDTDIRATNLFTADISGWMEHRLRKERIFLLRLVLCRCHVP